MNAAKIPAPWRDSLPILTYGDDVIWVCGYRVDQRFIVRPETQRVWLARFEKSP
jgi:tRNA(Ile)-lysidine synthase